MQITAVVSQRYAATNTLAKVMHVRLCIGLESFGASSLLGIQLRGLRHRSWASFMFGCYHQIMIYHELKPPIPRGTAMKLGILGLGAL